MNSEYDSSNLNNVIVRSFLPEVAICDLANGKQATTDGSGCECAAGSFQSDPVDTTLCSVCPSGFYSTQAAQTLCVACERGRYSKMERATTGDICRECDAGKFGAAIGLASDRACPVLQFFRCNSMHFLRREKLQRLEGKRRVH